MSERAGIWFRVSSAVQDEEHQRPDCLAWCETHDYDVAQEYVIHGKSAFKGNAKFDQTWAQVITDMLTDKITVLVVWKQDRIDRKLNTFQMLAQVVEAGGRVEFVTQPHLNDLTTMSGRIALKVQEEIAYAESKDKSDRVTAVHRTIRTNGGNPGRAPWGYISIGGKYAKRLEPTDEGRRLVPGVFERIANGESLQTVANWLESETDRKFWAFRVALLIRNPTYRGHRVNANGVTVHKCEALVDSALWTRANKTLTVKPGKRGPSNGESAMLTSVIFCGSCHERGIVSPMYRNRPYPGYTYYRCAGAGTRRKGCGNLVRLEETDARVTEWLSMMGAPRRVPQLVKGDCHEAEIADVLLELADLPKRGLSDAEEDAERDRIRAKRDELEDANKHANSDRLEYVSLCATCGGSESEYTADCEVAEHRKVTIGEHFRELDEAGRRAMMRSDGIKVYANPPAELVPGMPPVNVMPITIEFSSDEAAEPGLAAPRTDA